MKLPRHFHNSSSAAVAWCGKVRHGRSCNVQKIQINNKYSIKEVKLSRMPPGVFCAGGVAGQDACSGEDLSFFSILSMLFFFNFYMPYVCYTSFHKVLT
jgi:hypothetical protein